MTDVPGVTCDKRTCDRIIRPRKLKPQHFAVIALSNGEALTELGELIDETEVCRTLDTTPSTVFATRNGGDFVARCDSYWKRNPLWNWRATASEREIQTLGGERLASRCSVVVNWFGFKALNQYVDGVRHVVLDPVTFYGRKLDDIWPGDETVLERLLAWAIKLRDWTDENRLSIRPTNGALSAQFLRDRRFYPDARRKVPAAINRRCRDELPGNFYKLYVTDLAKESQAIYLDQRRAHHYHARTIQLPHADSIYARGRFITLDGDPSFMPDSSFHGLYYLRYRTPVSPEALAFTWLSEHTQTDTDYDGFVYSNEISLLTDLGFSIIGCIASWGGPKLDNGIKRIAEWAERQLDLNDDPVWLKPILLSAYGVLATRPKPVIALYGKAKRGDMASLVTGGDKLTGMLIGSVKGKKVEPGFANVLHRGMIEAATRAESLGYAHYLSAKGYRPLSIYADAVIIEDDEEKGLPLQIDPWRIKQTLTHLQFINKQAFVSGEMTRLPGVINRDILKVSRGVVGKSPTLPKLEAISGRIIVNGGYKRTA